MDTSKLICNSENITYNKGYVALWCEDYDLPSSLDIDGDTLLKKDHFHVSLVCVKNLLARMPDSEADILQHVCDFLRNHTIELEGFSKAFRLAEDGKRKSVVAMCEVSNLDQLASYLTEKLGIPVPTQPAHVTLYTLQPNVGISLNSYAELEEKSTPVTVPEAVLAPVMGYRKVVVVDEQDTEIGAEYTMDAIAKGMIRRAARIFVFSESGHLLLQQRSAHILKPLLLDQSAAGHVDVGEGYETAAYRELAEELGLSNRALELVKTGFRTTNFYNAVYKVVIPNDTIITFDPKEVETTMWYEQSRLENEMANTPERFTPEFLEVWSKLGQEIVDA